MFKNKILLITGGTGSFGNAVLDRFINTEIKEIRIFSRDEKKQDDMRKRLNNSKVKFYIGDVRDQRSVDSVVKGVDYIFHAAALKQVPSCEFFPIEAVKTNILGTDNVLTAAENFEVERVVVLSTDKAAYPINAMGMSKALMEKVMIAHSRKITNDKTVLCGTRYGNVMASRGSVIPLFIEQIKAGKPLTITDPNMTRFMMTLEDAVDLVLYAFKKGKNGDLFVQKSPAATIGVLVEALIQLYQPIVKSQQLSANSQELRANSQQLKADSRELRANSQQLKADSRELRANSQQLKADSREPIAVKIIGTRHGEKLFETLVNKEDMVKVKDLGNYYCIPADNRDLNYEMYFSEGIEDVSKSDEYHSHNTVQLDVEGMKKLLLKLPEIRRDVLGEK